MSARAGSIIADVEQSCANLLLLQESSGCSEHVHIKQSQRLQFKQSPAHDPYISVADQLMSAVLLLLPACLARYLEENVAALQVKFTPEELEELDSTFAPERVRVSTWQMLASAWTDRFISKHPMQAALQTPDVIKWLYSRLSNNCCLSLLAHDGHGMSNATAV